LDFASEQDIASGAAIAVATAATPASTPARSAARSTRSLVLVVSALVVAAAAITAALYGMMRPKASPAPVVAPATLSIASNPSDADVTIDGVMRGKTPLKISLAAG